VKLRPQHLPMLATGLVMVALFATFSLMFPHFLSVRVIADLFNNNAHVGVIAVGLTLVILSGGIDLSVGSMLALSTVVVAVLIERFHWPPLLAALAALGVGAGFGAGQGLIVQAGQLPPFLVTLAGMFLMRGLAFAVTPASVAIQHPTVQHLAGLALPLPAGGRLTLAALMFIAVMAAGLLVAHFSRFGRNVYALGGNAQSAALMGLPVGRTRILLYTLSGAMAALGGIVFALLTQSGNPLNGGGLELDAIAAVVIGGTLLTGGTGYLAGTLMGILIYGMILTALDFHGGLNSAWQRIAIGGLLLAFILLQRFLTRASARMRAD